MNTAINFKSHAGMTYDEILRQERKLRRGWIAMWTATISGMFAPLIVLAMFAAAVGVGSGLGTTSWPGYTRKGMKLAFWSVMGPLVPWILIISYSLITK